MVQKTLTSADHGASIDMPLSETLRLTIPENPTTGYQWQVDVRDTGIVKVTDSEFAADQTQGVGGGGNRTIALLAVARGTARITLNLLRDPNSTPLESFEVSIRVI